MLHNPPRLRWMESRFWIFTRLIRLMPWKDQPQRCSIKTNFTQLSSLGRQYFTQMIVPLTKPILAWYFRVHILWILEALLSWLCFVQMPLFRDKACHIIPYTVWFSCLHVITNIQIMNKVLIMRIIAVYLLNLHEDELMKPRIWIPVGWIPVYDESRDKRLGASKIRLYHQCWIELLDGWAERTCYPAFLGWWSDQVDAPFHRWRLGWPAGGRQIHRGALYVLSLFCAAQALPWHCRLWGEDCAQGSSESWDCRCRRVYKNMLGHTHREVGCRRSERSSWPRYYCNYVHYKPYLFYINHVSRQNAGVRFYETKRIKAFAYLFFKASWLIPNFCINVMYMRDTMHQIDRLMTAVLHQWTAVY